MSAAATIDFSRYAQPTSAPPPSIDFSKYEQSAPTQQSPAPATDPSTLHQIWNWANRGLISGKTLLNVIGDTVPRPADMKPGETTADYLTRVSQKIDPDHPYLNAIRVGLSGASKDAADTISSFTSPLGLGTMLAGGAGELPGATGKAARAATALASTGFAAQGAENIAHAATDNTKDLPTRVQEGLQGAATMAGGAAGAAESAGPAVRYVGERVTPKQVSAVVGGVAGAAPAALTGHPYAAAEGAASGIYGGTKLAETLFKERANQPILAKKSQVAPTSPEDFREPGTSAQTESAGTSEEQAPQETAAPPEAPKLDTSPKAIEAKLNDALGGKPLQPNVPLRSQIPAKAVPTAASSLPEGFTPVNSSAIKGYKYDPDAQQLTTISNTGQQYTHAEVTPDEFKAFQDADSKGKAWNTIRQNHVLTQKNGRPVVPGGPRTVVTDPETGAPEFSDVVAARQNTSAAPAETAPTKATANDEDLTNLLQQSLDKVKSNQQTTRTSLGQLDAQNGKAFVVPPGGVSTTAAPADLAKRWGVDENSITDTDRNLRGMNEQQSQAYINQLANAYKKGRPVEPVMETRDANNNVISVDGRHRALAAQRAGIERIPVIVRRIGSVQ